MSKIKPSADERLTPALCDRRQLGDSSYFLSVPTVKFQEPVAEITAARQATAVQ
jgi:hypothetical protein